MAKELDPRYAHAPFSRGNSPFLPSAKTRGESSHGQGVHPGTRKCEISAHLHRYEDYVDQHYKEFLKNQGKVDSVRLAELAGGRRHIEAQESLSRSSPSCPLSSCNCLHLTHSWWVWMWWLPWTCTWSRATGTSASKQLPSRYCSLPPLPSSAGHVLWTPHLPHSCSLSYCLQNPKMPDQPWRAQSPTL